MTAKTAIAVLSLFGMAASSGTRVPNLPPELASYPAWHASDLHAVSTPLSILCAALSEKDLARRRLEAQRAHGPHAQRYLRVFANRTAFLAARELAAQQYRVGSIIAKEKLGNPYATTAEGVAFMIKREPGRFPESGGWEFRYFPESRGASYSACIECHRTGASRDYVFSRFKDAAQQ